MTRCPSSWVGINDTNPSIWLACFTRKYFRSSSLISFFLAEGFQPAAELLYCSALVTSISRKHASKSASERPVAVDIVISYWSPVVGCFHALHSSLEKRVC
jgi:hypothetical protein